MRSFEKSWLIFVACLSACSDGSGDGSEELPGSRPRIKDGGGVTQPPSGKDAQPGDAILHDAPSNSRPDADDAGNSGGGSGAGGTAGTGGGGTGGVPPECTPGQQQTLGSCGLCGSNVQTCGADGKWGAAACVNQGVCSPGATSDAGCGNCGRGTQSRSCSSSCQWGAYGTCTGQPCAPGATRNSGSCGCGGTQRQTCNSSCNYVNSSCANSKSCNSNQVCSGGNCVCAPGKCGAACDGTLVGSVCCSLECTNGNCAACQPGCFC